MENAVETFRSLSQLEGEMKRAENSYVNADSRFQEAETAYEEAERRFAIARRERDKALGVLNECHMDIDRTLLMLREASPVGSHWREEAESRVAMPMEASDRINFILKD